MNIKFNEVVSDLWYDFVVNPLHNAKYNIKWFLQRKSRGFDDREIWNIDETFYKWLLPRLKIFSEKTVCYPDNYKCMSSWQKELVNRITQLELIVTYHYEEHNFPDFERYLTKKEIEEYRKKMDENQIKYVAFHKCMKNFNNWFNNNINYLWY